MQGLLGAVVGGFSADWGQKSGRHGGLHGGLLIGAVVAAAIGIPAALFPIDTAGAHREREPSFPLVNGVVAPLALLQSEFTWQEAPNHTWCWFQPI